MNVCIISGSSRKDNNTIRLAKTFMKRFEESGHLAVVIDFDEYDIPFPNQGKIDPEAPTPFQNILLQGMNDAQIILILTPEYNWFPSAEVVNMMHCLGSRKFSYLFDNKVFAVGGVSTGKGGRMPAVQLGYVIDKIISHFNKNSIVSSRKFESHFTPEMINEDGNLREEGIFQNAVHDFVDYTLRLADKWFK